MLEVENLQFSYGARQVLGGISFQAGQEELIFVLGANGAGKTTLFRCMLGLLHGYRGRILLDGQNVAALPAKELARLLRKTPDERKKEAVMCFHWAKYGNFDTGKPFLPQYERNLKVLHEYLKELTE